MNRLSLLKKSRINYSSSVRQEGFTLLEVLVAIAIFAVIIVTLFSSYTGSLRLMKAAEPQADLYRQARVTLSRIADDLESAYYINGEDDLFAGVNEVVDLRDADFLTFKSRAHISFTIESSPVGVTVISYYVEEADDGLILFRSDTPVYAKQPDEKSQGIILCDRMAGINFQYFDAEGDSYDEWSLTDEARDGKLPSRVSIQLLLNGIDQKSPILTFTTSVVLVEHRKTRSP